MNFSDLLILGLLESMKHVNNIKNAVPTSKNTRLHYEDHLLMLLRQ